MASSIAPFIRVCRACQSNSGTECRPSDGPIAAGIEIHRLSNTRFRRQVSHISHHPPQAGRETSTGETAHGSFVHSGSLEWHHRSGVVHPTVAHTLQIATAYLARAVLQSKRYPSHTWRTSRVILSVGTAAHASTRRKYFQTTDLNRTTRETESTIG